MENTTGSKFWKFGLLVALLLMVGYIAWASSKAKNSGELGGPTSADNAPAGSIHNLPVPQAVSNVRKLVATEQKIDEGLVIVLSAFEKEWPDACLGIQEEGILCAQVITPGYEVTVQAGGKEYVYHTNADGTSIKKAN